MKALWLYPEYSQRYIKGDDCENTISRLRVVLVCLVVPSPSREVPQL